MINLQILKDRGIDYEGLKRKLAPESNLSALRSDQEAKTQADKIAKLKRLIRLRISGGRENNIAESKLYHALDLAWETPFRQVSPTLLQSLMDKSGDDENVKRTLQNWGFDLNDVLAEYPDPKAEGKSLRKVNVPAFFQIFVPLVRAYVTIRLAKIMNDRRRQPYFKYEPAISNTFTRLQAEIITARVEMMNQHYDYWSVDKQAVFQMLHYGACLKFPMEEWHEECQETTKDDPFARPIRKDKYGAEPKVDTTVPLPGMEKPEYTVEGSADGERYERVQKEGLRYHMPHPSRTFIDPAHRPSTYNTDTGCEFAGYWKVVRYRDLKNNPMFYNIDKISIGAVDWWTTPNVSTFFSTVYNSCSINPPVLPQNQSNDRETRMAENYYTQDMDDASVVYTEYFQKLVPSDYGLGDYDYPVWFRFAVAADDTILYAAPVAYCPIVYYGYDSDELRAQNASLSLEILPFQDHFSNLMSQYLLSVKQNLGNITFMDKQVVKPDIWQKIKRLGHSLFGERNLVLIDRKELDRRGIESSKIVESFRLPALDTNGIITAMKIILDTLERVLVMSSQEVAQAATHEQTREEIRRISSSTSTRLTFTAIPVDIARDATKRQLYYGLMAYGEPEFYAQIPLDRAMTKEDITAMGFTYDDNDGEMKRSRRMTIKVNKQALMLENFISSRDGEDRINNVEGGGVMLQTLQALLNSPLYPVIGPEQFLSLINTACQLIGFPRDFKLQHMGEAGGNDQMGQLQQMLQQMHQAIMQEIAEGVVKPLGEGQNRLAQDQKSTAEKLDQHVHAMKQDMRLLTMENKLENKGVTEKVDLNIKAFNERLKTILEYADSKGVMITPGNQVLAPNATLHIGEPSPTVTGKG